MPTIHSVEITISANQSVSVAWREPNPLYDDWGCAPTLNAYDPKGAGSEWFAEIGVVVAMDGWAVIDEPSDICWFHFSFVFASPADWNTYVPEWPRYLAQELYEEYFYPVPTPGNLAVATLGDGALEATVGTEVVVAVQAEAQSAIPFAPPGSALEVVLTLPCAIAATIPTATVNGSTATWTLPIDATPPATLQATTTPGCV